MNDPLRREPNGPSLDPEEIAAAPAPSLETPVLVAYLAGADPESARAVEAALVRDPAARSRLLSSLRVLRRLRKHAWCELPALQAEDSFVGEVAEAWTAVLGRSIQAAAETQATQERASGPALEEVMQGAVGYLRQAIQLFGEQLQTALQIPRLAVVRDGELPAELVDVPGLDPVARLRLAVAEVDREGTLHVRVESEPGASAATRLRLNLRVPLSGGPVWPVGEREMREGAAEWRVPGLGGVLGLSPGTLPLATLDVRGTGAMPAPGAQLEQLLAAVVGADGRAMGASPRLLTVAISPRWRGGVLELGVTFGGGESVALPGALLELALPVSTTVEQLLGRWPLSDWDSPEHEPVTRVLRIPCPGAPDAAAPFLRSLRARLRLPAA